jgi:hypothetical protein
MTSHRSAAGRTVCIAVMSLVALCGTADAQSLPVNLDDLSPDSMVTGFDSLAAQIAMADAAIVGKPSALSELRAFEAVNPRTGQPMTMERALAMYSIEIVDVLYERSKGGRQLAAGDSAIMGQMVGRESAVAYLEKQTSRSRPLCSTVKRACYSCGGGESRGRSLTGSFRSSAPSTKVGSSRLVCGHEHEPLRGMGLTC